MVDNEIVEIQILQSLSAAENPLETVASTEFAKELAEVVEFTRTTNKLGILLSGKTGTGKSTLVNGLIGAEVAKVSKFVMGTGMTTEVKTYSTTIKGLEVTVWDSPGLQDGTKNEKCYLNEIATKCEKRDLVLYCISMLNTRFVMDNMDVRAMKKLTKCFGSQFWAKTVIVLTFANAIAETFLKQVPRAQKEEEFSKWLSEWSQLIKTSLIKEVGVKPDVANNISIVPAGHQSDRSLPDRPYWLSDLWVECLNTISTPRGQVGLLLLSGERIKSIEQVTDADFHGKPLHEQPIVIDGPRSRRQLCNSIVVGSVAGIITGGAAAGAIVGAGVGAAAVGLGVFVGLPVGLIVGVVSGTVGAVIAYKKTKRDRHE